MSIMWDSIYNRKPSELETKVASYEARIKELEALWEAEAASVHRLSARELELEEQLRWKSMTEEFPSEPKYLEVVYENAYGHRWCEVHKVSKPQGDMLGLAKTVLWRELTPLPKGV